MTAFTITDKFITVDFQAYRPNEIAKVKSLPVRTYNPNDKTWTVPRVYEKELCGMFPQLDRLINGHQPFTVVRKATSKEVSLREKLHGRYTTLLDDIQVEGVAFLLAEHKAILADDMGLGKSRQAIVASLEADPDGCYLIICPANVKLNWRKEIRLVDPDADCFIVTDKTKTWEKAKWTIINYDILRKFHTKLLEETWATVIIDEAHYIKNKSARAHYILGRRTRTERIPSIIENIDYRFLLTGTPISNRPIELYQLLKAIEHPVSRDWIGYVKNFCDGYKSKFGWVTNGESNLDELAARISDKYIKRFKTGLKGKRRDPFPVEIDNEKYAHLEGRFMEGLEVGDLAHLMSELAEAKVEGTIQRIKDILETGEKVLVFSYYRNVLDRIGNEFGDQAVIYKGGLTANEKQAIEDRFSTDSECRVFAGQLKAAGVGLDSLKVASYVVFNDYWWVPADHDQAEDRAYRRGQEKFVYVSYMHAEGTLDDDLLDIREGKVQVVGTFESHAAECIRRRFEHNKPIKRR